MLLCGICAIFLLMACNHENDKYIEKLNFATANPSSEYSEFLYFNGRLYGISSEVVDEEVFKNRIGKQIGEIKGIDSMVKEDGDVGVENQDAEFLFKPGDGIHEITDTSNKLLLLIKTSKGYLHTKLIMSDD
ncbi:hypothetical protein [Paenibacillus campinasensis]|nr:hypothetical protein [Paenibacillus campinasensis]